MVDEVPEAAGDRQVAAEPLAADIEARRREVEDVDRRLQRLDLADGQHAAADEEALDVEPVALGIGHRPDRHGRRLRLLGGAQAIAGVGLAEVVTKASSCTARVIAT